VFLDLNYILPGYLTRIFNTAYVLMMSICQSVCLYQHLAFMVTGPLNENLGLANILFIAEYDNC